MKEISALEFFSGIGAFRLSAAEFAIEVKRAFDQSQDANRVYRHNFAELVCARNLDTISGDEIPSADFWWMSPSCKPYSRRGKGADLDDQRASSFINLLEALSKHSPDYFAMENVYGFLGSRAEAKLDETLVKLNYSVRKVKLCPTQIGVPMQRPRLFVLAAKEERFADLKIPLLPKLSLQDFIDPEAERNEELYLNEEQQGKYFDSLNIVNPLDSEAKAICFTSGYEQSMKASGSYIQTKNQRLRRFSPEEMLKLFGFPSEFQFPAEMSLRKKWVLLGNTIEQRTLKIALTTLLSNR
ncbi:MAG: DNA cytosine methyltransferase [Candidatus Obscuribacterales bacterium]|nr:DNA cytosine methyltransferase [Candidatus Obscuribacterales bacterium]